MKQIKPDNKTTRTIAKYLADRADARGLSETQLCKQANLSASYISKAKKGDLQEIAPDKLRALAAVLELNVDSIYRDLDIPLPSSLRAVEQPLPLRTEPPIRLRFPYISAVPDQAWPLLAREVFSTVGIELIEEPLNLSEFKMRMADVDALQSDTLIVLPISWFSDATAVFSSKFNAVAVSHLYHGYGLVGRQQSAIRGLDTSPTIPADGPTLCNLFVMLAELRYKGVLKTNTSGTIACCEEKCWEFVRLLIDVAKEDKANHDMLKSLDVAKTGTVVKTPTLTFLEPLSEVGIDRYDFVVGHALTTAAAHSSPNHRVFADYRNLEQLVELLPQDCARKSQLRDSVKKLQEPIVVALNASVSPNSSLKDLDLPLRICAAVNRASETLFKALSTATLAALHTILENAVPTGITPVHLRRAWESSYDFMNAKNMLPHFEGEGNNHDKNSTEARATANYVMHKFLECEDKAREALKTDNNQQAQRLLDAGDFYGACKALGLTISSALP